MLLVLRPDLLGSWQVLTLRRLGSGDPADLEPGTQLNLTLTRRYANIMVQTTSAVQIVHFYEPLRINRGDLLGLWAPNGLLFGDSDRSAFRRLFPVGLVNMSGAVVEHLDRLTGLIGGRESPSEPQPPQAQPLSGEFLWRPTFGVPVIAEMGPEAFAIEFSVYDVDWWTDTGSAVFLSSWIGIWVHLTAWTAAVVGISFFISGIMAVRSQSTAKHSWYVPLLTTLVGIWIGFVQGGFSAAMIAALFSSVPYSLGIDIAAGLGISQGIVIIYFHLGRADFIHT